MLIISNYTDNLIGEYVAEGIALAVGIAKAGSALGVTESMFETTEKTIC